MGAARPVPGRNLSDNIGLAGRTSMALKGSAFQAHHSSISTIRAHPLALLVYVAGF